MNIMIAEDSNRFIEKLTMSIHGIKEISSISKVSTREDVMKQFIKTHYELEKNK